MHPVQYYPLILIYEYVFFCQVSSEHDLHSAV